MCLPLTMQNGMAHLHESQSSCDSGIGVLHDGQGLLVHAVCQYKPIQAKWISWIFILLGTSAATAQQLATAKRMAEGGNHKEPQAARKRHVAS